MCILELLYDVVLCFVLFAFCGWVCESIFCSILERKPVNRGFLNGPFCPVYGFGGILVVFVLAPLQGNYIPLFFCGMISCTLLEYATSWLLEKLFHAKWWDYSDNRFNIHGRVCLSFSLVFGALSIVAVELLYPPFSHLLLALSLTAKRWIARLFVVLFAADCAVTVRSIIQLNGKLEEIKAAMDELRAHLESIQGERITLSQRIEQFRSDTSDRYAQVKQSVQESLARMERFTESRQSFQHRRLIDAFPNLRSTKYQEQLSKIKESIERLRKERK